MSGKQNRTSEYKTPAELADALNIGYPTVVEYCRSGAIHNIRIGKLYRIPAAEYDRVLREGVQPKEASA